MLVLPGGTDFSYRPFSWRSPSALRMYPFTLSIAARFGGRVAVEQAEYRVYGWNGEQASPMPYARAALDRLAARHPGVPIHLIGHSMGGRVGAHLAGDPRVHGLLALAPWWQYADWRFIGRSVRVVAMHGTADTRTFARRTEHGVAELLRAGVDATYIPVANGGHAMLDHIGDWHRTAMGFVSTALARSAAPSASQSQAHPAAPR
ncbi:alpha/beta hydrolase [Williamsia sp. CHRR-6]|uniref:alpha/beta hydrolase n=1 Tax=Williamsia sp. CHRR-6 TaxID=2835871 RepID=UPI0027DE10D1|nr:alpha/beta hydrolase [Williamsia sp. CHRR-6]